MLLARKFRQPVLATLALAWAVWAGAVEPLPHSVEGGQEASVATQGQTQVKERVALPLQDAPVDPALEKQREVLRLEFRIFNSLNDLSASSPDVSERLRVLEESLADFRPPSVPPPSAGVSAVAPGSAPMVSIPVIQPPLPVPLVPAPPSVAWSAYYLGGALLLVGLGGWLFFRRRPEPVAVLAPTPTAPAPLPEEDQLEPTVDIQLDINPQFEQQPSGTPGFLSLSNPDFTFSPPGLTPAPVDQEPNPVLELAEIMLSFGRVKGAAQALQEFIDTNPERALQPWIRLLDVYRQADMKADFEDVASRLNRHFNVEIQHWHPEVVTEMAEQEGYGPMAKARSLEEMPHIRQRLLELWSSPESLSYLEQLQRDNRGGQRSGFTLSVIEEILFLATLKETLIQMDKESAGG